ncbi:MAG: sialate O-acetylesterase [Cellulophaga sp.]|nr:sialate O-acetylesterase [Cellulophaga sp.]
MNYKKTFLSCSTFCIMFQLSAQLVLPNFFSDHMVLQQNDSIALWGWDTPNSPIEILTTWDQKSAVYTNDNGAWKIKLKTNKASFEPQAIEIKGSSKIKLSNVLIGEVWFCSGQSNMEMPIKGFKNSPINGANELIANAKNPYILLFNTERQGTLTPETNVKGTWEEADYKSVSEFSAIGYVFAKKIFENINTPIGIIEASWGGTIIEAWIPKDSLVQYSQVKMAKNLAENPMERKRPTQIYNGMIAPFKDFTIKGLLWYQGESNRNNPEPYKNYMHTLVNSWRSQFKNNMLPFYFVQIAPYAYEKNRETPAIKAALIREAQLQAANEIKNSGMVVTADVGDCNDIHPPEKILIAHRLAYWALAKQYGFLQLQYQSPTYKNFSITDDQIKLFFEEENNGSFQGLSSFGNDLEGFTMAGEDQKFYPAEAIINSDGSVTVTSNQVTKPVAVRYGFEDCFKGTLFDTAKLPISPFRTDRWTN